MNGDDMKNYSIWKDHKIERNYEELKEDKEVDVLIIGGGLTGVSSLYHLRESNLKVMLVEQNKIGHGVTGNSTGKLTYLQNDLLDKIRHYYSDEVLKKYLSSQIKTIKKIKEVIEKEQIDCDLEEVDSYLYTNKTKEIEKLKDLERLLLKNNIPIIEETTLFVKSKFMIKGKNTYLFHPIKFLYGLLKKNPFPIYEHTSIRKIEKEEDYYICDTNNDNRIKTKIIILASHYPYFIKPFYFPLKVSLEKSYLSASIFPTKPFSLISYSNPFISIRTHNDYLIYLSNSHSLNKNTCDKENFKELLKKLKDFQITPEYCWSNIDIMTSDSLPLIGEINKNMYLGTGYNTWGLTNGFLAGKIITDIISERENEYIELFSPKRLNEKHILSYIGNTYKNIDGYMKGYTSSNKTKYKCPHLGCRLIYNELESTFECPCHGSKFREDGTCISAPANKDLKIE